MKNTDKLKQVNFRLPRDLIRILKMIPIITGQKMEHIATDAIYSYLGSTNPELQRRRREVVDAASRFKDLIPF